MARREHDDTCRVRRTCGLDLEIVVNEARSIALPAIGYGLFYQDYRFRLVDGTSSATTLMTYSKYLLGPLIKYCLDAAAALSMLARTMCLQRFLVTRDGRFQGVLDRHSRCKTERKWFKLVSWVGVLHENILPRVQKLRDVDQTLQAHPGGLF